MMVREEHSSEAGSGQISHRDPSEILRESRGLLNQFLILVDELDVAIRDSREDAIRERDSSHRWGL
jgi:hypothetical protein